MTDPEFLFHFTDVTAAEAAVLTPTVICRDGFDIFGDYRDGMCMEHGGIKEARNDKPDVDNSTATTRRHRDSKEG
jgi:hypothetical protein